IVELGGTEDVSGDDTKATVDGLLIINPGATSINALIRAGGIENVQLGGVASGTVINLSGNEYVQGNDTGATIYGSQTVGAVGIAGSATNATVENGGVQNVIGGTSTNTTVLSGGTLFVSSGGSTTNQDIKSGGKFYLNGHADPTTVEGG